VRSSGILKRDTPVLTVRLMTPGALKGLAGAIESNLLKVPALDRKASWSLDGRRLKAIFGRYETWFAEPRKARGQSMEVVGSPLLAYLTFRTLADWPGDPAQLIAEPTALYKVLIDITVRHSGKGRDDGMQSVQSVHRGGEPLRRLLHKVASVISILGREAVSFAELRNRLEEDDETIKTWRSEQGLRGIVDDATRESVLHELVVNFYFKGGNTSIGCEFLHKSFREYLFAEAIVTVLKDLSNGKSGPLEAPKVEYWQDFADGTPQFKASRALSRLLSPQWLTDEVRMHLLWLLKKEIEAGPKLWEWICGLLLDIYIWWAEGVHLRPQPIRKRGKTEWLPAFVNELLEYSLPLRPRDPSGAHSLSRSRRTPRRGVYANNGRGARSFADPGSQFGQGWPQTQILAAERRKAPICTRRRRLLRSALQSRQRGRLESERKISLRGAPSRG
jgi:hypothetical protein